MTETKETINEAPRKPAGGFNIDELFTDPNKDQDGVWVEFFNNSRLKLASIDSPKYKAYLARVVKANKLRLDDDNEESLPLIRKLTAEAISKHVLLDWEGINMDGKQNIKYTPEVGFQALTNSTKFREFVTEAASDHSNFRADSIDRVKKP